jgi:hypothetical protein
VVLAKLFAQDLADLAEGGVFPHGGQNQRHEVLVRPAGCPAQRLQRIPDTPILSALPDFGQPGQLDLPDGRVYLQQVFGRRLLGPELVDPDDHAFAALDVLLGAVGGLLNLPLHETLPDRGDHPPQGFDAVDVLPDLHLDAVGQGFDVVGAG